MEGESFRIHFPEEGIDFPCRHDQVILEAMVKHGRGPIRHGCFGGGCGVCKVRVLTGEYAAVKRMSAAHITERQLRDGYVLACCITPKTDLTLARPTRE